MTDTNSSSYESSDMEQNKTTQARTIDTRCRTGKGQITARREGLRSAKSLVTKRAEEIEDSDRSRSPLKVDDSTPFATSKEEDSDDGVKTAHKKKEGKWEIPRDEDGNTDEERLVEKAIKGRGRPETTGGYRLKKEFLARKQVILEQRREEFLLKGMENPCEEFQDCTTNRKYKAEIKRLTEHLEEAPFRDVTATILEASTKVLGFSQKSKSLKGTHVKVLRDAAAAITAGANIMAMQMAQDRCGSNMDLIEELRTENANLKTSLTEVRKELEEVKQMLRGIREAPLHEAVVSSPPSKHPGNVSQGVGETPRRLPSAPPPLTHAEKERAITPPAVDMMEEEEEAPIGIIEVQKGLIPRERRRPVRERKEARVAQTGPKIRENILLDNRVRIERREEPVRNERKGLEGNITQMVFKALNEWKAQGKELPKKGAGKEKKIKGVGSQGVVLQQGGNRYEQEYPQLPPTRAQRKEQQAQKTPTPQEEMWTKVVGRRERKKEKETQKRQEIKRVVNIERKEGKKNRRRVPNTAAVTITAERGQYKDLLSEAKRKIDLTGMGIEKIKTRVGATGALVIEIPGEQRSKQADQLADKLKEVLTDRAKINRPQKMGELRLKGLEIATTESEAAEAVAKAGGCQIGEVKTGSMRTAWNNYRTLWIQCPLAAAKRVAETGSIKIGWTQTKAELLQARALQCYRCLEKGHVQTNCKNNIDRRANCYRCGEPGHLARECLGIAAEPHHVPKNRRWFGDELGSVAIVWKASSCSPPAEYLDRGRGFVVARWGAIIVVGVYLPPTKSLDFPSFKSRLRDMGRAVRRYLPGPVIIAGDFNAKSETWGSRDGDRRGEEVEDWAAGLDLHLLNEGRESTFVGSRGESIIDLTWASPAALKRVRSWRVADELEALSDHLLIEMELSVTPEGLRSRQPRMQPRPGRWSLNKLDREALDISLEAATWPRQEEGRDLDSEVMAIMEVIAHACDEAMPRVRSCPKRSAWWWTDAIADLRHKSVHLRRAFRRVRNDPHSDPEAVLAARREFCLAAASLRDAIGAARGKGWDTLLLSLDADPWGRPYKLVMNKLKPWTPPLTETLDPRFLERVMGTLFPVREGDPMGPYVAPTPEQQGVVPGVTEEEVAGAIKRVKSRKAPGPDGIPGRVLTLASGYLGGRLARIFSRALRERRFPPVWGRANVVLLRKEGKPEGTPSAYRPICLLDEAGKLFERVIAARLVEHMSRIGPNLDDGQYGFREGRSTVDAIRRLRSLSEAIVQEGGVAVAVSLDIANAFNTLPWAWRDADGKVCERGMSCGVPQGLGLVVAERKTEAIFLHSRRMKPPQAQIRVGRVRVPIEAQMRYLGLTLDGTWCFRQHFNRLVPRLRAVSSRVSRLMPRTGGPDGKARRLHAGVLNSVALYGAPIWAEALAVSRPIQATLRRVQRALAVRVARCYRTVSHVAATVLASMPPLELMALSYMGMYDRKRELLRMGGRKNRSPGQSEG
ncbi:uncharacterized protein LOC112589298 [Harpegnathos saltator]|uniref:uncharacterized protein LOC112589298 n=1 Tax=Harpegnathos saltator TaxID=610380 RepID=UPI000DBEDCB8|nr:uncharacterized protein LOC112589298 [Harpegnathos saltator]